MKKPRKITIVEPAGYCAGVDRAIKIAKATKEQHPNKNVVILGMLVHNLDAINKLSDYGIKTLSNNTNNLLDLADEVSDEDIVILTAHGHSDALEDKLNSKNINYVDATCPFVKKALIDMKIFLEKGHDIIYIGKDNHPESNAALSLSNKVHLLTLDGDAKKYAHLINPIVVSQSTFSDIDVKKLNNVIKKNVPSATFYPSICKASISRQNSLLSLDKDTDLIIVVGGKNSNNTMTLYNLAKNNFLNTKVLLVENKKELMSEDINQFYKIAIVSGASTPLFIVEEIKSFLEQLDN